jgi:2-polyprenyl-3-methyl-5-hydroxy-6-metoxy-1,4-benzoquinol methylase
MPIGSYSAFTDIVKIAIINKPKMLLDCGIGKGILAAAVRNWVDDSEHKTTIHGVEGFAAYRNKLWGNYDNVEIANLKTWMPEHKYNMIVLSDVIEHFKKFDGREIVQKLKDALQLGGVLIISTPAKWIEQGAVYGNELETHKSFWTIHDFKDFYIVNDGEVDKWGNSQIVMEFIKP